MINPHIIIDQKHRICLCGQYHGKTLSCSEIVRAINSPMPDPNTYPKLLLALEPLIIDCKDE